MKKQKSFWPQRPALVFALAMSIPAFYLVLTGSSDSYRHAGSLLYLATTLMMAIDLWMNWRILRRTRSIWKETALDVAILIGAFASALPMDASWSLLEWFLRLAFCSIVFLRIGMMAVSLLAPGHILLVLVVGVVALAISGAGFYWLEPKVSSYADGLWLAFITGATVGYGDLVPSTPASRIFAAFIVMLGYAIFSVVTASISALFVGEDEKRFEKELHADIRALREEITSMREEMHQTTQINAGKISLDGPQS
jgi:voltage-gated potassium channel